MSAGLLLFPVVLSCLLMAAHVLRSGMILLTAGLALLPFLLMVRRPWVPLVLQLALLVAAAEWLRTLMTLAHARIGAGEPWVRMAVILGAVVALTLASVFALQHADVQRRYGASRG